MNTVIDNGAYRDCTGCGMCSAVCPANAIAMVFDKGGFYTPHINRTLCTDCGLCRKTCYRFDGFLDQNAPFSLLPVDCFSAVNHSAQELKSASSGAVSIELMRQCIRDGYAVAGVAYDYTQNKAVTRIAVEEQELAQFRGSKYFQSDTADAYRQILKDKSGKKYAIFGTPCQIYAFSKVAGLKKNAGKYLLVDIFCHGCPSFLLWKKYLEDRQKKWGVSSFDTIQFRSKTHGWHEYSFDFTSNGRQYSSSKYNDPFYELFFGMDTMNKACYNCVPRSSIAFTDIRIGDFWGRQFDTDTTGVSVVIAATERGKRVFDNVKDWFECSSFSFADSVAAQSYGKPHVFREDRRNRVLSILGSDLPIKDIVKKYRAMLPVSVRLKRIVKQTAKRLPQKLYLKIKRHLHER